MRKSISFVAAVALFVGIISGPASAKERTTFTIALKGEAISVNAVKAIEKAGGKVTHAIDKIGVVQVSAPNTAAFLKAMISSGEVESIGPSLPVQLDDRTAEEPAASAGSSPANPADPSTYTWGVDRVTAGGAAWQISQGSKRVVVGIIDTGIDLNHPDLVGNIVPGSRTFVPGTADAMDENSHGTHVAGTIAANGRIRGVAPGVGIRAYRVFGATGGAEQIWITDAIMAAANDGVDVINLSLGGYRVLGQWFYTDPVTGETIKLGDDHADVVAYKRAVKYATQKNVTIVAAAGNDGQDISKGKELTDWYQAYLHSLGYTEYTIKGKTVAVPAGLPGVITVSAMAGGFGSADRLAFYSNYGKGVIEVAGPGGDVGPNYPASVEADFWKYYVLSTTPTNMNCNLPKRLFGSCAYGFKVGTSMAAPHVAGAAALIIDEEYARTGKKPKPSDVAARLTKSAQDIGAKGPDELFGRGLVNAYSALTTK